MYSLALAKGRESDARGKPNSSRLAYGFAQALMRDLNNFETGDASYNIARAYTKALNDSFTRSFAGDILAKNRSGAFKTAPEMIANDVFQSDAGYLRMKQLDQIGQFELTQALTNLSTAAGNPDLQKTLNRAITYSVNEDTGLVDTARLNKWLKTIPNLCRLILTCLKMCRTRLIQLFQFEVQRRVFYEILGRKLSILIVER